MTRKYANLRLESLRNAGGAAAVGAALLLDPGEAAAANVTLTTSVVSSK
jgi:hypothetical protein